MFDGVKKEEKTSVIGKLSEISQVTGAGAGIVGFHKWFSSAFPTAIKRVHHRQQDLFDHVCIDMNQILHVAVRKAANEDHAVRRLYKDIGRTLKQCVPRQSVVFAFDGSAPLAKLLVQRSRRENMKRNAQGKISALHLSPGTEFMEKMASAMEHYASLQCKKSSFRGVKFYISGASVPGEGELKCVDWIKHMCAAGTEESAVIVGGDADLILQGLALTQVKNLFVLSPRDHDAARCTSIWEVIRSLEDKFPGQSEWVRLDLMVLMILNGNDYLPKARGVAFRSCIRSYVKLKAGEKHRNSFLVDGEARAFSRGFMADLFVDMAKQRAVQGAGEIDKKNRYPPAGAVFKQVVSQGKLGESVELQIHPCSESLDEDVGGVAKWKWRSTVTVRGRKYSWLHTVGRKKTAMHEAAEMLMKELLPDVHKKFLEQEVARRAEEGELDDDDDDDEGYDYDDYGDNGDNVDDLMQDQQPQPKRRRSANQHPQSQFGHQLGECSDDNGLPSGRYRKKELFDVEAYLSGILWNIQMYVDGYAPNFYWQYAMPYGPSCLEIASWIKENPEAMDCLRPPVSSAPPLPSTVSGLCMMPMNEAGRALLPKRLQPLLAPGSLLREALKWRGAYRAGLDVPRVLRALQEQAPRELIGFTREGSHRSHAWTVVSLDEIESRSGLPSYDVSPLRSSSSSKLLPNPSETAMPPRGRGCILRPSSATSKRVRVGAMTATAGPRCIPWSSSISGNTSTLPQKLQRQKAVRDQPYKKAFVSKEAGDNKGGRGRGRGHERQRRSRKGPRPTGEGVGNGRRRRNEASVGRIHGGFGIRVDRGTDDDFSSRAAPAMISADLGEEGSWGDCFRRPPDLDSVSRQRQGHGRRVWMCQSLARPYCRLRL